MKRRILPYSLFLCLAALEGCGRALEPVDHQPVATLAAALKDSGQKRIAQGYDVVFGRDQADELLPGVKAPLMVTTNAQTGEWTVSLVNDNTVGTTLLIGTAFKRVTGSEAASPSGFDRGKAADTIGKLKDCGAAFYPEEIQRLAKEGGYRRMFTGQISFMVRSAFDMAADYYRQEIDDSMLNLTIDGKQVQITQRNLRKAMTERVNSLNAELARLQNGGDRGEISRVTGLIKKYGARATPPKPVAPDFREVMKPIFADVLMAPDGSFCVLAVDQDGASVKIAAGGDFSERQP